MRFLNNYVNILVNILVGIVVLLLGFACSINTRIANKSINEIELNQEPQIVFLNYSIHKNGGEDLKVKLIDKQVVLGSIKNLPYDEAMHLNGNLVCIAFDENQKPLSTIMIPDPLNKSMEYVGDDGKLNQKKIELDSAFFTVRMQLQAKTSYITLKRIIPEGTIDLLITEWNSK